MATTYTQNRSHINTEKREIISRLHQLITSADFLDEEMLFPKQRLPNKQIKVAIPRGMKAGIQQSIRNYYEVKELISTLAMIRYKEIVRL